jgi:hypothetical protein
MEPMGPGRLFRAVVVAGAALGAGSCRTRPEDSPPRPPDALAADASTPPDLAVPLPDGCDCAHLDAQVCCARPDACCLMCGFGCIL